jgi:hypothetical protein
MPPTQRFTELRPMQPPPLVGPEMGAYPRRARGALFWSGYCFGFCALTVLIVLTAINFDKIKQIDIPSSCSECSDDNQCTKDFELYGACEHLDYPNTRDCTSTCYESGALSKCNGAGECIGTGCLGTCETSADCPVVNSTTSIVGGDFTVACIETSCVYSWATNTSTTYASDCSNDYYIGRCNAAINETGTYVPCMKTAAFCTETDDPSDDAYACVYWFGCKDFIAAV